MEPKDPQMHGRQTRQEPKAATSLVECTVQASPTLARLIRKCAAAEAGGASARDALLASAGVRAIEIEGLRDQSKQQAQELGHTQELGVQLQSSLDRARGAIAQRDKGLIELRRELKNAAEAQKESRQTAAALGARIVELQKTIEVREVDLNYSVPIDGLDERAVVAMRTFRDRLCRGEDIKTAALGIAGYTLLKVEAATAKEDRDEMRSFDALLASPGWRRRVVLWLLGARTQQ